MRGTAEDASDGGCDEFARVVSSYGSLLGRSEPMLQLFAQLRHLERVLVPLLVHGPSGCGKELVARELHRRSRLAAGPFVAINCGSLDRTLARSELFGHRRGAFTGAVANQAGSFELAADGTLFLDEVGELPLDVQPILLRVLELGVVSRVGESEERPIRARVIAATHRDLSAEVRAGRFREDLFYRLNVVTLQVPPLSDGRDIELLAQHFAKEEGVVLPVQLVARWQRRPWRGNARELRNAVRAFSALGVVAPASTPLSTPERATTSLRAALREHVDLGVSYADQKRMIEQTFLSTYLEQLLERTNGNQSEAARLSGLTRGYIGRILRAPRR